MAGTAPSAGVNPAARQDSRVLRVPLCLPCTAPQGVLALNVPIPGLRRHLLLTKTLEWNLYW